MTQMLKCKECDETQPIPVHCGKAMHIEKYEGKEMLICWMGANCGIKELPIHHGKPMSIVDI